MIPKNPLLTQLKKQHNSSQVCLICGNPTIGSHSVQNGYILDQLVDNGHVWIPGQQLTIVKESRNKAQVFRSLCNTHDTNLFKDIDFNDSLTPENLNSIQVVQLIKRSLFNEKYRKQFHQVLQNTMIQGTHPIIQNAFSKQQQSNITSNHLLISLIIKNINQGLKDFKLVEKSIENFDKGKSKNGFVSKIYEIECSPSIAVCSLINPTQDFNQKTFFDMTDFSKQPPWVSMNILPIKNKNKTVLVFSYHKIFKNILEKNIFDTLDRLYCSDFHDFKRHISSFVLCHTDTIIFSKWIVHTAQIDLIENLLFQNLAKSNIVKDINLFQP